jgi:hypothetical protein
MVQFENVSLEDWAEAVKLPWTPRRRPLKLTMQHSLSWRLLFPLCVSVSASCKCREDCTEGLRGAGRSGDRKQEERRGEERSLEEASGGERRAERSSEEARGAERKNEVGGK